VHSNKLLTGVVVPKLIGAITLLSAALLILSVVGNAGGMVPAGLGAIFSSQRKGLTGGTPYCVLLLATCIPDECLTLIWSSRPVLNFPQYGHFRVLVLVRAPVCLLDGIGEDAGCFMKFSSTGPTATSPIELVGFVLSHERCGFLGGNLPLFAFASQGR